MEKEHKSKNKIHKVKKEIPVEKPPVDQVQTKPEAAKTPDIEVIHTESVIEEKSSTVPISPTEIKTETLSVKKETSTVKHKDNIVLGTFPKKPVPVKEKKVTKTEYVIPFYIFVIILFGIAFAIGGVSARIIPNNAFDFLKNLNKHQSAKVEVVQESTVSATPAAVEPKDVPIVLKTKPPIISAKAFGIYTFKNGEYKKLTDKNPDAMLPMASVTKVMTALVALENYDLDKPVVIPAHCVGINASSVGFRPNDVFSLQDVLYGMLVKSGADAACAIASIDNEADFIAKMNAKAVELGMTNTKFTNPIGLDNSDAHVSDINDLKILVTAALKYGSFRKIVGTEEISLTSKSGARYNVHNTNDLLFSIPGTVGIKTGFTDSAGECLAYLYQNKDQEILIIVLGSVDRFGDTSKLLDWAKTETAEVPADVLSEEDTRGIQ
jgi:D-alanyl-D-alanine carboxypeptidase